MIKPERRLTKLQSGWLCRSYTQAWCVSVNKELHHSFSDLHRICLMYITDAAMKHVVHFSSHFTQQAQAVLFELNQHCTITAAGLVDFSQHCIK